MILDSGSCNKQDRTYTNHDFITREIRATLSALSDSLRLRGLTGWISFLDTSTEFTRTYFGSTSSYDTTVARIRYANNYFTYSTLSWDSLWIQAVKQDEATVFAICTDSTEFKGDALVITVEDITAKLRRINGAWKFLSIQTSAHNRWRGQPKFAFSDTSEQFHRDLDSLVKSRLGREFTVAAVLDVDDRVANGAYRVYQAMGYIFEDPRHQFEHSFIVTIRQERHDRGSVAIVRNNKLVWRSKPLMRFMDMPSLKGIADVNADGNTDIVISTSLDMRGYGESLWIITPDSLGGRLLNRTDDIGESTIVGATDSFSFNKLRGQAAYVIDAHDFSGESNHFFCLHLERFNLCQIQIFKIL